MRQFILLCLLLCGLSSTAQQQKPTTAQKAPSTKTVPAKAVPQKAPAKANTSGSTSPKGAPAKTAPAKAAPAKVAPAKATPAKATPAKVAPAKVAPAKNTPTKAQGTKASPATPTNNDIKKLKGEQTTLQKQIKASQTELNQANHEIESNLANLAVINGRISTTRSYVDGIQAEVDTLSHNIGLLGKDLNLLEEQLAECKRKYSHALVYMYRTRLKQNKLTFIFSAKDFHQMYRRVRYAQEYTKYQQAQATIVQKREEAVRDKKNELESTTQKKRKLITEGRREQEALEGQQRERQTVVDQLNRRKQQLQTTIASQQERSRQLDSRIDQLIQAEIKRAQERRKAEEARLAEEQRQNETRRKSAAKRQQEAQANQNTAKPKAKTGAKTPANNAANKSNASTSTATSTSNVPSGFIAPDNSNHKLSSNFESNRGRLPVPITGAYVISAHYGLYTPEGLTGVTLDNKGTNFSGRQGAQARCVFDGEVTSVFNLGGTTNVIVRHGSYISVYCNLSSVAVHTGQTVSTRQNLGTIATDANGNATLHFQLRKETAKLNPELWISR